MSGLVTTIRIRLKKSRVSPFDVLPPSATSAWQAGQAAAHGRGYGQRCVALQGDASRSLCKEKQRARRAAALRWDTKAPPTLPEEEFDLRYLCFLLLNRVDARLDMKAGMAATSDP
jgi:hypothetical protein